MYRCPCCDHPLPTRPLAPDLKHMPLVGVQKVVLDVLASKYPYGATQDTLLMHIYSGALEPDSASVGLGVQIHRLRAKLKPYGWTVPNNKTGKGVNKVYKLEPI